MYSIAISTVLALLLHTGPNGPDGGAVDDAGGDADDVVEDDVGPAAPVAPVGDDDDAAEAEGASLLLLLP